jgi:hypothetical protein
MEMNSLLINNDLKSLSGRRGCEEGHELDDLLLKKGALFCCQHILFALPDCNGDAISRILIGQEKGALKTFLVFTQRNDALFEYLFCRIYTIDFKMHSQNPSIFCSHYSPLQKLI